ncbi:MAG: CAP domain-containing protein [Patescibacteria group bacterium]|nr:CAP domain-containing protein [Patescibacteria group bacterium]MDE2438808.1 CAP domain-containing protein [Patescibacteria group bacterium]
MYQLLLIATLCQPADALQPENVKPGPHDWLIKNETIVSLHKEVNLHRARSGLPPVAIDTNMCLAAQRHAVYMSNYGFMHSGLPYMEIINQSHPNAQGAVYSWAASPPHNGIMLSNATSVGFGYALRGGYPYWVGVFR